MDQLDFFVGKQKKSNHEGFIVYNNDEVYGYKWRNWKMHLVELENMNSEARKLNVLRIYNLITDPKEEYNMASEATYVLPVMFKKIVEFQSTLAQEPPIPWVRRIHINPLINKEATCDYFLSESLQYFY